MGGEEVISSLTVLLWKIAHGDSASLELPKPGKQLPAPRDGFDQGWVQPGLLPTRFVTSQAAPRKRSNENVPFSEKYQEEIEMFFLFSNQS